MVTMLRCPCRPQGLRRGQEAFANHLPPHQRALELDVAHAEPGTHLGDGTARSSISGEGKRFFYSATVGSADKVLHLKLVNASTLEQPLSVHLTGVTGPRQAWMVTLHAATYQATNSITDPDAIHPEKSTVSVSGGDWKHTVPALTIEVIDVPLQ